MRLITVLLTGLLVLGGATQAAAQTPVLTFDGTEQYQAGGQQWVRYKLRVVNWASYADALFTPAPNLPPCGLNPNSSRAWVYIRNGQSPYVRLYGFCALGSPSDLQRLWFAVQKGKRPPRRVFITITDRLRNWTVWSNTVSIGDPSI